MPRRINDHAVEKIAVAASGGSIAPLVMTKVDGSNFARARFIFLLGNGVATTASLSASAGVWVASTSGATFTQHATALLAAVTSGAMSATAITCVVDLPISSGTPWMQFSGSMLSTGLPHAVLVELYNGNNNPPTTAAQQLVTV